MSENHFPTCQINWNRLKTSDLTQKPQKAWFFGVLAVPVPPPLPENGCGPAPMQKLMVKVFPQVQSRIHEK
jgi:hypothetical protein